MKHLSLVFFLIVVMMICSQPGTAQIPRTLSYQGVLTDSLGSPKPDGTYGFTFRLYSAESGGSALWTESKSLETKRGLFSTILGDHVPFPRSMKFDDQYWLSVQVASQPELSPRLPLSSVGYSLNSLMADTARYALRAPVPESVDSARIAGTVKDGAITTAKILNGTILFADLAQNGATDGQVIKWSGGAWTAAADATGGGSSGGGWTDGGATVGLTNPADTVALNTTSRLGKLNINGDIGLNLSSSLYFGSNATRISGLTGGDLRLVAQDLSALTTEDITFGHYGDETWIKFDNANKRVGIGTLDPIDRLHVVNENATSCWMRVETSHPSQWGQAGLRIKTPQNMWNLRMDTHTNANIPDGGLSLYSQNGGKEAMTWLMDGRVGIGIINPVRKLHVNGSAQVKDTLYAGTINATKVLNGPGVAHKRMSGSKKFPDSYAPFDTVTIRTPGPGYVLVLFTGVVYSNHDWADRTNVTYSLNTSPTGAGQLARHYWSVDIHFESEVYYENASLQGIDEVPSSGTYSYYIGGNRLVDEIYTPDEVWVMQGALTALFVPSAYGPVAAAAGEIEPIPTLDPNSNETRTVSKESVESRLDALTRDLQVLRDDINSRSK